MIHCGWLLGHKTLEITVNADNGKAIMEIFKKTLIENGMGHDTKDIRNCK